MTTSASEAEVRRKVWLANRAMHRFGLCEGSSSSLGHASMRLPDNPNLFMIKGREMAIDALAVVQPDEIIVCDLEGNLVAGKPGLTQVSEVKIHSCIYRARANVQAVVHAHPKFAVLMGVLRVPLVPMCQEGATLVRRPLPVYPHRTLVHSDAEGSELAEVLGDSPAALMRGHGAVTIGRDAGEAVMAMAQLEEQARLNCLAYCATGKGYDHLSDELLDEQTDRAPLWELPHFKDVLQGRQAQRDGIWAYHELLASHDQKPRP